MEPLGTLVGLFGFFGAVLGLVGGIALIFLADMYKPYLLPATAGPAITHGFQCIVYTLPACMTLGSVMGCGIAAACTGRAMGGLAAVMTASLLIAGFNLWLWWSQIVAIGRNEAEIAIHYPPLILSVVAWILSIWLGKLALWSKGKTP